MTELAQIISNQGTLVVVAAVFFWEYMQSRKHNREREEKLYKVIETLADQIPEMKSALERIEKKLGSVTE